MSRSSAIFLSLSLRFLSKFSSAIFFVLVPFVAVSLQVDALAVQTLIPIFLVGSSVSQFGVGSLADTFGKRPVLMTLLTLLVLGSIGCVFSQSLPYLQASVFVVALGVGAIAGIGNTLIFDGYSRTAQATKALALSSVLVIWAPAIAMNFGSSIAHWDWRYFFLIQAILGAALGWFAWNSVPRQRETGSRNTVGMRMVASLESYWKLLSITEFRVTAARMCLLGGGIVVFYSIGLPDLQNQWGTQHWVVYLMPILMVSANSVGRIIAGLLPDHLATERLDLIGSTLCLLSAAAMLVFSSVNATKSVALFTIPLFVAGVGLNFSSQRVHLMVTSGGRTVTAESLLGILMALSGAAISYLATMAGAWLSAPVAAGILLTLIAVWSVMNRPMERKYAEFSNV